MRDAILKAVKAVLDEEEKTMKQDRMTPEIVALINEKKKIYKNKDETRYKSLKNKIKCEITIEIDGGRMPRVRGT